MPFRYRRRIRIAKGVSLNVGKRGITSVSIGRRGATMNVNRQGTRETFGAPGTGMSYQTRRRPGCGCGSAALGIIAVLLTVKVLRRR